MTLELWLVADSVTVYSENTLIGATNDQNGKINSAVDFLEGDEGTIPEIAKRFKARDQPWMIVTDVSARPLAQWQTEADLFAQTAQLRRGIGSRARFAPASFPRCQGHPRVRLLSLFFLCTSLTVCRILDSRSFARIHRMNLTKQGVLPLTLVNEDDYSLIDAGDKVSTKGFNELLRGDLNAVLSVVVEKPDGSVKEIPTHHGLSQDQVRWLKFGSALNMIKADAAAARA